MRRALLVLPAVVVLTVLAQARVDAEPVKVKLDKAKAAYAAEEEKFRQEIGSFFDKREDAARKAGDKKGVDLVKTERKAFEDRNELPATAPKTAKQRLAAAKTAMDKAYALAVKENTMAKMDSAAAAVEKEFAAFKQGLDPLDPRRKWVHTGGTFTRLQNGEWEEKSPDGRTYKWKEVGRTKEYVELQADIFGVPNTVRLGNNSAEYQSGKASEFKPKFTGKWAD